MNAEGETEEARNEKRVQEAISYFQRQLGYFYLSQDLLSQFDEELDRVYQRKIMVPGGEINLDSLIQKRMEMNVAWEFNERNLHETQAIYERLLQASNSKVSAYQAASEKVLKEIDGFFSETWRKDRWAAISVAQDFEIVNQQQTNKDPDAKLPEFRKLARVELDRSAAFKQSVKELKARKSAHIDSLLKRKWEEFKAQRIQEQQEANKDRAPQTDAIYPDPGSPGNITGNRFAAGVWAITLDDGPHPTYTQGMLDAIQGGGLRATFFWLSQNIKLYPSLVKRAADYKFRRGSHSFTHANLPKLGDAALHHEIDEAADVFATVVGERPTFFRCPYGACGSNGSKIRQKIAAQKMIHVFWNVDSLDWQDKNPASIFARVKKQMEVNGHGIVLFHDIHPQSVEAMKQVVAYIKSKPTWNAYTMDEIVKMETGNNYHSP
jgi:peptidoglycan/xylan/chitin deacetylase (PgdA/CDA1 family)